MEGCVEEAVEYEKEHGSDVAAVFEVLGGGYGAAGELFLECVSTTPDAHGDSEQKAEVNASPNRTGEPFHIKRLAKADGTDHLAKPVEQIVEGTCADVEIGPVDAVELVSVEPVAGQEHGEHEDDVVIGAYGFQEAFELGLPGRVLDCDDSRSVFAYDVLGFCYGPSENEADCHENHEGDVGGVVDLAFVGVQVLTEGDL